MTRIAYENNKLVTIPEGGRRTDFYYVEPYRRTYYGMEEILGKPQTRRDFIKNAAIALGLIALPKANANQDYVNPKKFNLHEYTVKSYTSSAEGTKEEEWTEYFIHYGNPDNNHMENRYALKDLFSHPIKGGRHPDLEGKCKDGWEHQFSTITKEGIRYNHKCVDGEMPAVVRHIRERIDPLIIFYYRSDGDAVIGFHPDKAKDKKFHLEQLAKLRTYSI